MKGECQSGGRQRHCRFVVSLSNCVRFRIWERELDWCFSGWRPSTLRILKETDEILLAEQQRDVNHLPILIEKRERGNPAPYLDVFHGIHRRRAGRK